MLYDGDCGFCQACVAKWGKLTAGHIKYEPYQKVISGYKQVSEEACRQAVQLIMPQGQVFSGSHAVFKAFALSGRYKWFLWCYEHVPLFGRLSEWFYQTIARHRSSLSKISGGKKCDR